jgi:spermidine/putrescine transport system permease protein
MGERANTIMSLLITMPTWVNMLVRTYAWMGILQDEGVLNSILSVFGIGPVEMIHTSFAVILGMVYNFIPFMILQIHTSLAKMDKNLLNAANDLGANPVQAFLRVTLPLSVPGIISGITMVFVPAMSTFAVSAMLGGGEVVLLGQKIEEKFLSGSPGVIGIGSTLAIVLIILVIISMVIMNKVDKNKVSEGGTLW